MSATPGKPLIVCADDYAASAAISRGIVALARAGRITATSAMTLAPRWARDAAALRELRGQIDVGLHLDWTSPFAIAAGHGTPLARAMLRAAASAVGMGLTRRHARAVIERQLDAFEAQWRAPPDHVDGHQHVQQFAGIRQALIETLARRYPGHDVAPEAGHGASHAASIRPWLRISRVGAGQAGIKGRVITALGASALERQAARAGLPCAPELWGVYDFTGGPARYAARLQDWIARAPARAVLMCHPAQGPDDAADAAFDTALAPARQWEFDTLGSAAFGTALAQHGIALTRGSVALR